MKVICISEGMCFPVKMGEFYDIPYKSIWIDADGDAYGDICDINTGEYLCQMLLRHFCSC